MNIFDILYHLTLFIAEIIQSIEQTRTQLVLDFKIKLTVPMYKIFFESGEGGNSREAGH